MKTIFVLTTAMMMSSLSFAASVVAPVGDYATISCISVGTAQLFGLAVVKNDKKKSIKLVITRHGEKDIVYQPAVEKVPSIVGAPLIYTARATGGVVQFTYHIEAPQSRSGKPGVLTSSSMDHVTKTDLACNVPRY